MPELIKKYLTDSLGRYLFKKLTIGGDVIYGGLYNHFVVQDSRNIAPEGWHIMTEAEATTLLSENTEQSLKSQYNEPNDPHPKWSLLTDGTNTTGYSAAGSGAIFLSWGFDGFGAEHWQWLAETDGPIAARVLYFYANDYNDLWSENMHMGAALRIVKDDTTDPGTVTGNDGTEYNTIKIGNIVTIDRNLAETKYRNGDNILLVTTTNDWDNLNEEAAMCYYNNDINNALDTVEKPFYFYKWIEIGQLTTTTTTEEATTTTTTTTEEATTTTTTTILGEHVVNFDSAIYIDGEDEIDITEYVEYNGDTTFSYGSSVNLSYELDSEVEGEFLRWEYKDEGQTWGEQDYPPIESGSVISEPPDNNIDVRLVLQDVVLPITTTTSEPTTQSSIKYGRLYTWEVTQNELISGMIVPTDNEWNTFTNHINTNHNQPPDDFGVGNHLKHRRRIDSPLGGEWDTSVHPRWELSLYDYGRDTLGFGALPAGERYGSFGFFDLGGVVKFWTSSEWAGNGDVRLLAASTSVVTPRTDPKTEGLSIRCFRNATQEENGLDDGSFVGQTTDYDGNIYDLVKISDKVWTVQNFAGTHFADGTPILHVPDNTDWGNLTDTSVAYCDYDNDEFYTFFQNFESTIW